MRQLLTAIPDADVLLGLEPEELGAKMLFVLRETTKQSPTFHLSHIEQGILQNNLNLPDYPREKHPEIIRAVNEAWAWLLAQGLVVSAGADQGARGWMVLSRRAKRFEDESQFADYATARLLQRDMLHPSIATAAWQSFMRGDYPTAVFQAMRQVEIAVREAAGFAPGEHGVPMIRRAFGKTGPLSDPDGEEAERDAPCALFAGAVGSYKNPHSHRNVSMESAREAAEIVMLASHLLRVVDVRAEAKAACDAS